MEKSSFFNSVNGDRKYKAEDFRNYFSSFIGNGVFPNPSNNCQITANSDMTVTIRQGKGWINGGLYENTTDLILPIDAADGALNRIDRIVLRLDTLGRAINVKVKKSAFASAPVAPDLQRDSDAYELGLADIYVNKGSIGIIQANITDLRLNTDLCGIVHGTVDQVDTTAIFNQFESWYLQKQTEYNNDFATWTQEKKDTFNTWYSQNVQAFLTQWNNWFNDNTIDWAADFNTWFNSIKNKLGTDIAGNLQNQINDLDSKVDDMNTSTINEISDIKMLYINEIKDTIQTPTFDSQGNIIKLEHKDTLNNVLRTDSFIITSTLITETRELSNGDSLTLKYYFNSNGIYNRTEVI